MTFHRDKTFILAHENLCNYNPKNKQCGSCANRYLSSSKNNVLEYKCKENIKCKIFPNNKLCKKYIKANHPELRKRANAYEFTEESK